MKEDPDPLTKLDFGGVSVSLRVDWSVGIGGSTWTCAELVCDHLSRRRSSYIESGSQKVLELGAGTGLAGIYASSLFSAWQVVLTDLPDHVPLLRTNNKLNSSRCGVVALDWTNESDLVELDKGYDLIIATDCAYHERLHIPLTNALVRACSTARCIFGATKSDTGREFFEGLSKAGLEYSLIEDGNYCALFMIEKRPDNFMAQTTSLSSTTMPLTMWVRVRENRAEGPPICAKCGKDARQTEAEVCECGEVYCSKVCRRRHFGHASKLCVGPVTESDPLYQLKSAISVREDCDELSLSLECLVRSEWFERKASENFDRIWSLIVKTGRFDTRGKTAKDFSALVAYVKANALELARPHPLVSACRKAYLEGTEPPPFDMYRYKSIAEDLLAAEIGKGGDDEEEGEGGDDEEEEGDDGDDEEEGGNDDGEEDDGEMSDHAALKWILAAPESFFEPVRILTLVFLEVAHSCAATCEVKWCVEDNRAYLERKIDGPTSTYRRQDENCQCEMCAPTGENNALLEAAARRDDRWDDLETLLLERERRDPAAMLELSRLSGWRGDFEESRRRLERAKQIFPGDEAVVKAHAVAHSYFPEHQQQHLTATATTVDSFTCEEILQGQIFLAENVLDPIECRNMTRMVEDHVAKVGWSTSRHYSVPTTDIPVTDLPELLDWFNLQLEAKLFPLISRCFCHDGCCESKRESRLRIVDAFFVKYSPDAQRDLPLHTDQSDYSLTIAMNSQERDDNLGEEGYEGGGTYFPVKGVVNADVGGVVAFDGGSLLHGGYPTRRGKRYILAVFISAVDGSGSLTHQCHHH